MFKIDDLSTWVILLVEDDDDNIEMARQVLMFNGANLDQLYVAADGHQGVKILEEVKPTVILLDLSMPEMDGWEMYRQARLHSHTKDVPIIAVTAHAMETDRKRAEEMGFNGYIIKPYSIMTFIDEIKNIVRKYYKETFSEK